jgi:hypothetical protein
MRIFRGGGTHSLMRWLQNAVEPPQESNRQDHILIILGLVVVLNEVGGLPQKLGDFGVVLRRKLSSLAPRGPLR